MCTLHHHDDLILETFVKKQCFSAAEIIEDQKAVAGLDDFSVIWSP